ncbi:hypothetical protein HUT18_13165 [Streptomyces sp. NA04227]|nr:hypothetical protein HUT18_13165 [Streptomyces sp. NA04227]
MATASPALLHRVGERALAWLDTHREYFRLTPEDLATGRGTGERLKPLAELGTQLRILAREGIAGSEQHRRATRLLDFLWGELLDGGGVLARLHHNEPFSPVPLEVYAVFHELGHRHPGLEASLRTVRGTRSWAAMEVVPNRRLGLRNAERRMGLTDGGRAVPGPQSALEQTWLDQLPEPWTVHLHTAYDITHTIFHLTNWGEAPERVPAHIADYLTLYLPAWLEDWADLQHWDLLGELLVVDACLPRPGLDADIWARFAAAQSESGAMPLHHEMPDGDPDTVFDIVHHPTIVAAFASAMATSRALEGPGDGGEAGRE